TAMALRPEDRYSSPRALAEEIERWLADEPVEVYREPATARLARWARRRMPLVTAAAALLVTGVVALTVGLVLVKQEQNRTEARRWEAVAAQDDAQKKQRGTKEALEREMTALGLGRSQRSRLARSLCEVSDREFRQGHVWDSLNWMLRAYEVAPEDDPLRGSYRYLLAAQGRSLKRTLVHDYPVMAVAFSPDGRTVLTGSSDHTARLWDAASGKDLGRLKHDDLVRAVAFSPDGRTVLTGSYDRTARLWDVASGKELANFKHDRAVLAAAFSPDGRTVLTGSADFTARLWDVASG